MSQNAQREQRIQIIASLPAQLRQLVSQLSREQLMARPIDGEWSVAQNVHHMADSHMNSFIRLKLILTEENPTLKPYDQDAWGRMNDEDNPELESSLLILDGLHQRWVMVFRSLDEAQWQRTGYHPEIGAVTVADLLETYASHCQEHVEQLQRTLKAQGQ
ncbi:MAG: DinB family protein [Caldilineaceae bacterium]|nr:DinB family protein [Caldilineaceae bacterium]